MRGLRAGLLALLMVLGLAVFGLWAGIIATGFAAEVRRYRFRGSSGKVNLALDGLPDFRSLPGRGVKDDSRINSMAWMHGQANLPQLDRRPSAWGALK